MDALDRYLEAHLVLGRKRNAALEEFTCAECKDTGWIMVEDGGQGTAKRCRCRAGEQIGMLIKKSELPEEFFANDFNSFDDRNHPQLAKAKSMAVRYAETFNEIEHERYNSILFCGQVGSGKTHLGTAICSRLIDSGIVVMYMPYRNAVTKIKQLVTDEVGYGNELDRYRKARVLYVDDLFKGKLTDADVNIIYEIVNYRYMNKLPLIISTEKSIGDLLDFDEAIGSRIIEMCRKNIVQLKGKELNYRLSLGRGRGVGG